MATTGAAARPKNVRRPVHGVLLLDKEIGLTSNAAVQSWKRRLCKSAAICTLLIDGYRRP